jgi:hypothetical protein
MTTTVRLARAEARKLFTTRAVPAGFAAAIALTVVSVVIQAPLAGQHGTPRLGTDASTYKLLNIGVVPLLVMLILGILAAGGEFRHRTIVPVLLATPRRGQVFAVKVVVIAASARSSARSRSAPGWAPSSRSCRRTTSTTSRAERAASTPEPSSPRPASA